MWTNKKGDSYCGEWEEGKATGFGAYLEVNASQYEGSFIDFVKNGEGKEKFSSGDLYKGQYTDGKFNGTGDYYWKDGSFYKGQFKNGLKHGYGVFHKA